MDYIKQVYNAKYGFWRYIIGSVIVIMVVSSAQIPLMVYTLYEGHRQGKNLIGLTRQEIFSILDSNLNLGIALCSFIVGLFTLYFVVKKLHEQSFTELTTARKKIDWKRVLAAFLISAITTFSIIGIMYFFYPENYVVIFNLNKFIVFFIIAVFLGPFQSIIEEYVFRGYVMQGIGGLVKNRWFPLIVTSLLFGFMHILNPEVQQSDFLLLVLYIGFGFFLGLITLMDEGLELAIGFHTASNMVGMLLVTSNWNDIKTYSVLEDLVHPIDKLKQILVLILIIYPLIIFIFSKIYKWENWKYKLFGKFEAPRLNEDEFL